MRRNWGLKFNIIKQISERWRAQYSIQRSMVAEKLVGLTAGLIWSDTEASVVTTAPTVALLVLTNLGMQ